MDELAQIRTYGDAHREVRAKCSIAPQSHVCQAWVDRALAGHASAEFQPTALFCKKLREEFRRFDWQGSDDSRPRNSKAEDPFMDSALQQSSLLALSADLKQESFFEELEEAEFKFHHGDERWEWGDLLFWQRRRRTESKQEVEEEGSTNAADGLVGKKRAEMRTTEEIANLCDRDRCSTVAAPHTLTEYHYINNEKDLFKKELYEEGPIYTSYYIYEDFTWFFEQFPTLAYKHQWGTSLGGHAVVLLGWIDNCEYHDGNNLLETDVDDLKEGALIDMSQARATGKTKVKDENGRWKLKKQRHGSWADSTRRRSATGMCWHLRNTWGEAWGDGGYFKLQEDMLTGPEGTHLHIASAAGDGALSKAVA